MDLTKGDLLCKGKGGMSSNRSVGISSKAAPTTAKPVTVVLLPVYDFYDLKEIPGRLNCCSV